MPVMMLRSKRCAARRPTGAQRGFTMVEVLVALVVLAIGLLGIAALYMDSLRAGRSAIYRTQAVNFGADIADRIRANRLGLGDYATLFGDVVIFDPACESVAGCAPTAMAATDLSRWKDTIAALLPEGQGQVAVTLPLVAGDPALYVITIRWTELGQDVPAQFQLRFET
jgi:type IV pilus assembly protein PilV